MHTSRSSWMKYAYKPQFLDEGFKFTHTEEILSCSQIVLGIKHDRTISVATSKFRRSLSYSNVCKCYTWICSSCARNTATSSAKVQPHVTFGASCLADFLRTGSGRVDPHLTVGALPHLTVGALPHLTVGVLPHLTVGVLPHLTVGALPHLSGRFCPIRVGVSLQLSGCFALSEWAFRCN